MTDLLLATDSERIAAAVVAAFGSDTGPVELLGPDDPPGERLQILGTGSPRFSAHSIHERLFVVDEDTPGHLTAALHRLHALLTGRQRITPSRAEFAMHAAYGAALRSAAQRGGVGAALVDANGEVLALGTAEVPRAGGGQYWDGDPDDARDFRLGPDPASTARTETVGLLLHLLAARGVTLPGPTPEVTRDLLEDFDAAQHSFGVGHGGPPAQTFESLGRVVHAEMAALLSAARTGVRTVGTALHVTGRPCRQCLRHLVGAGLRQVVHFGPRQNAPPPFHADSVTVQDDQTGRLPMLPFTGIGPGAYPLLFSAQTTTQGATP
jgi:deoxycytidylate deaminase